MNPENTKLAGEVARVFRTIVQQQLLNKLGGIHRRVGHMEMPVWASVVSADQLAQLLDCPNPDALDLHYGEAFRVLRRFEYLQYGTISNCTPKGLSLTTLKLNYYRGNAGEVVPASAWFFYINDRGREFIRQMDTDEKVLQYLGMFRTGNHLAQA